MILEVIGIYTLLCSKQVDAAASGSNISFQLNHTIDFPTSVTIKSFIEHPWKEMSILAVSSSQLIEIDDQSNCVVLAGSFITDLHCVYRANDYVFENLTDIIYPNFSAAFAWSSGIRPKFTIMLVDEGQRCLISLDIHKLGILTQCPGSVLFSGYGVTTSANYPAEFPTMRLSANAGYSGSSTIRGSVDCDYNVDVTTEINGNGCGNNGNGNGNGNNGNGKGNGNNGNGKGNGNNGNGKGNGNCNIITTEIPTQALDCSGSSSSSSTTGPSSDIGGSNFRVYVELIHFQENSTLVISTSDFEQIFFTLSYFGYAATRHSNPTSNGIPVNLGSEKKPFLFSVNASTSECFIDKISNVTAHSMMKFRCDGDDSQTPFMFKERLFIIENQTLVEVLSFFEFNSHPVKRQVSISLPSLASSITMARPAADGIWLWDSSNSKFYFIKELIPQMSSSPRFNGRFQLIGNGRCGGLRLEDTVVRDVESCAYRCLKVASCQSFTVLSIAPGKVRCKLHGETSEVIPKNKLECYSLEVK